MTNTLTAQIDATEKVPVSSQKPSRAGKAEAGADFPQGQEAAVLIATAVLARQVGDRPLEQKTLRRLNELYIPLIFGSELKQPIATKDNIMLVTHENVRTTDSKELLDRFSVELVAPELFDHKQLPLTVFREDRLSNAEYARLLHPLDANDIYLRTAVGETFSAEEVDFLREFFGEKEPSWKFSATPAKPIVENTISTTGICVTYVGGPVGRITWTKKKDSIVLPHAMNSFGAQYDFRCAEAGPYLDALNARIGLYCQKGGAC
jgi:hypothetical protein